jgi:Tfp pilus assembly protein PilX
MKSYLPKSTEDGAALIITLLIVVLLATIAVSFLSTARIEQSATRNYASKAQAEQLATMATQQAMANLQTAFNDNGPLSGNYAAVVTSQPGAITKYFFQNGTCTQNPTANLFFTTNSPNANGTVNMNNLDNSTNSTISGLITGNSIDVITVARVDVRDSSGNQTIGRIAYYIDDESTKINLNSLAGNKTTLNAGYGKTQSLSGVVPSASVNGSARFSGNLTIVDSIVNGLASNSSNSITTWTSFFRPEQAQPSFSINSTQIKHYSAAPLSDFHLKYTPWGTQRLFINDEPISDTGVKNIFSAMSGLNATTGIASSSPNAYEINGIALRHIFNGTFSDKYSSNGTKQIAANMLQMRDKNTVDNNFYWRGAILGSANMTNGIPQSYFAHTPFTIINEVAIQPEQDISNNTLNICVYVELWAPYYNAFSPDVNNYQLIVNLQSATGTSIQPLSSFTLNRTGSPLPETSYKKVERFVFTTNATNYNGTLSVTMGDIRLLATPGNASTIRDWIKGDVINSLLPINTTLNSTNTVNYTVSSPWNASSSTSSIQRKDIRIKYDSTGVVVGINNNSTTSPWGVAPHTLIASGSSSSDFRTIVDSTNSPGSVSSSEARAGDIVARGTAIATPFTEYGYHTSDWPADHMGQGYAYYHFRHFNYGRYFAPTLIAKDNTGNATISNGIYVWPADIGKVMTDRMYRTLRMYWQPTQERARGFIPDWALLDLVSFSSNQSSKLPLKIAPMNLNGSFNCLSAPTPRPRNNIQCLTKPFDSILNVASSLSRTSSPATYTSINMVRVDYLGVGANASISLTSNLTQHITSNSIAWTRNGTNTWNSYRTSKSWPSRQLILPGEVSEIRSVADFTDTPNQNPTWLAGGPGYADHWQTTDSNENRLAAFFPGLTTCSNFFTIYAYAQSLDKQGNVDSEALTKSLIEVEITTPATATSGAVYRVKSLYSQPISMEQ